MIREDRRETDVFSLIGPKCFDIPWREIERQGWIAQTKCTEIRIPLLEQTRVDYARAEKQERFRIAAENSMKQKAISELLQTHAEDSILIIGQYVEQIQAIAKSFEIPCIHGKTPQHQRDALHSDDMVRILLDQPKERLEAIVKEINHLFVLRPSEKYLSGIEIILGLPKSKAA